MQFLSAFGVLGRFSVLILGEVGIVGSNCYTKQGRLGGIMR